MQRLRRSLAIPLLFVLVLVQHGATLHELNHLAYSAVQPGAQALHDTRLLEGAACPSCLAFAQVASAASTSLVTLAERSARSILSTNLRSVPGGIDVPTPRSRGPPSA